MTMVMTVTVGWWPGENAVFIVVTDGDGDWLVVVCTWTCWPDDQLTVTTARPTDIVDDWLTLTVTTGVGGNLTVCWLLLWRPLLQWWWWLLLNLLTLLKNDEEHIVVVVEGRYGCYYQAWWHCEPVHCYCVFIELMTLLLLVLLLSGDVGLGKTVVKLLTLTWW